MLEKTMNKYYVGIDTSAYTTSIGVVDDKENIIANYRQILKVNKGSRGLRQQDAVFQHINNIPDIISTLKKKINMKDIKAIGYTDQPRNIKDSYMPVFNVSKSYGISLSEVLGIKSYNFSHQEGHIAAGLYDKSIDESKPFICIHLSGGTTEVLLIQKKNSRYFINIIGGTKDISAGQLIDRIGVKLQLDFPSGKSLDKISKEGYVIKGIPISIKENWINFSGPETYFIRLIENKKYKDCDIAKSVFYCINNSLENILLNILKENNDIETILIVGGVASNTFLRENFLKNFNNIGKNIIFSDVNLSTDNGVGVAILAKNFKKRENYNE
ncbi:O-sialoglycoprotein endopeptidase [Clostridium sp. D2Q-14]|uniref:O-sialoglycoprotein endopeptidase n=1 Tax=Anaeromonas gelatinilytica TaxID=2683194 RepID=UPI00193C600B|nr:O-sialoglycoprotein endopeptidase [Anaeromonas gelatinilytica]MBS4536208.1 O-sialoglycoprotein endopeptidase [Anaeromonas gelatinilytica]